MVRLRLPEALQYKPAIPTILRSASASKSRRIKRIKPQRAGWRRNKEAMMRGDWMEISRLAKSKSLILRQAQDERIYFFCEKLELNFYFRFT